MRPNLKPIFYAKTGKAIINLNIICVFSCLDSPKSCFWGSRPTGRKISSRPAGWRLKGSYFLVSLCMIKTKSDYFIGFLMVQQHFPISSDPLQALTNPPYPPWFNQFLWHFLVFSKLTTLWSWRWHWWCRGWRWQNEECNQFSFSSQILNTSILNQFSIPPILRMTMTKWRM